MCSETKFGRLVDDIQQVVSVEVKLCHSVLINKFVKFVSRSGIRYGRVIDLELSHSNIIMGMIISERFQRLQPRLEHRACPWREEASVVVDSRDIRVVRVPIAAHR